MHYLEAIWALFNLIGSIATAVIAAGLLTGKLELRRRPSTPEMPRTIVVHETCDAKATADEIARIHTLSGERVL